MRHTFVCMGYVAFNMFESKNVIKILCGFVYHRLVFLLILSCALQNIPNLVIAKHIVERGALLGLYENDNCKGNGICKKDAECPELITWIKNKQRPEICSFNGMQPIVCCPVKPDYKFQEQASGRMCLNYTAQICPDWAQTAFGGVNANPKELPFMALVGFGNSISTARWLCSGSLISPSYVLTAGHCVLLENGGDPPQWCRLGDLNYSHESDDAKPQDIQIAGRFTHPSYRTDQVYFDIALLRLKTEAVFTEYVKPICLNQEPLIKSSTAVFAAGWGQISASGPLSSHLQKVSLDVVDQNLCSPQVKDSPKAPNGIANEMICAGKNNSDTCRGDSGGPLYLPLEKGKTSECTLHVQIGITSFGTRICGERNTPPAVYTSVAHYIKWIEEIVWPQ